MAAGGASGGWPGPGEEGWRRRRAAPGEGGGDEGAAEDDVGGDALDEAAVEFGRRR